MMTTEGFFSTFLAWGDQFLIPFDDPGSRLFVVNLAASLLILLLWLLFGSFSSHRKGKRPSSLKTRLRFLSRNSRRFLGGKKYWLNSSAKIDYKIYFLNSLFKVLLFYPFLDFSFAISATTVKGLHQFFDQVPELPATGLWLFLFSAFAFVFDDLCRFLYHVALHKVPWLWRIHRVHHSATSLNPMTLYRIHPLESALATLRNSLSWGVSLGVFMFFFESDFQLLSLFGINLFGAVFNLAGSNFRHSHIWISFGALERVFISPAQHQMHHASNERLHDTNFGVSLAIWDQLIQSWRPAPIRRLRLRFGIAGEKPIHSLKKILWQDLSAES